MFFLLESLCICSVSISSPIHNNNISLSSPIKTTLSLFPPQFTKTLPLFPPQFTTALSPTSFNSQQQHYPPITFSFRTSTISLSFRSNCRRAPLAFRICTISLSFALPGCLVTRSPFPWLSSLHFPLTFHRCSTFLQYSGLRFGVSRRNFLALVTKTKAFWGNIGQHRNVPSYFGPT